MANIETDFTLSKSLLEQVETVAREMKISRNELCVLALEDFLRRQPTQQLMEQANQAYQDESDEEERAWLEHARHS
jgi:metal-responsive CopG/Arc/MetJ family transcriptional regulator